MFFTKNMRKSIGKNRSKNFIGKYSQQRLDYAEKSAIDALKTSSKRAIQKSGEAGNYLIGNKIAN